MDHESTVKVARCVHCNHVLNHYEQGREYRIAHTCLVTGTGPYCYDCFRQMRENLNAKEDQGESDGTD